VQAPLPNSWPLTDDHLAQMNAALDQIETFRPHVEKAKRAGLDVDALLKQMTDTEAKLKNVKQHYFPGR
jgi:hypothetical protein